MILTPRLCLLAAAVLAASTLAAFAQHSGRVGIAFSLDGTHFLSAGNDRVILWDAARRTRLRIFAIRTSGLIAYLPDGRTVVSSDNHDFKIWDVVSGDVAQTIKVGNNIRSLAVATDGRTILLGLDSGHPQLWDLASGRQIRSFEAPGKVGSSRSVAMSPDGRHALSADALSVDDEFVSLWEITAGRQVRTFKKSTTAAFSPDGRTFLAGRTLYDLASGAAVRQFGESDSMFPSVFSGDGRWVLTGHFKDLKSWEVATGRLVKSFPSQSRSFFERVNYINSLALAPDNSMAVTGSDDGHVRLWNVATGNLIASFDSAFEAANRFTAVSVFTVPALVFWVLAISSWRKHRKASVIERQIKSWPTARGHVLSSTVEDTTAWTHAVAMVANLVALFTPGGGTASGGSNYLPRVHYRYLVGENTYDSDRIQFTPKKFGRLDDAEAEIKSYPVGTEVTVRYMPQDPSIAVLSAAKSKADTLYVWFGMSAIMTALVIWLQYVA
jgi:hypothetical protein